MSVRVGGCALLPREGQSLALGEPVPAPWWRRVEEGGDGGTPSASSCVHIQNETSVLCGERAM